MDIYVGSTNPAKVRQLSAALIPCGVQVGVLPVSELPDVAEDRTDAVGNARQKAIAFSAITDGACLTMDASLLLPDLPEEAQPGVHVRRLPNRTHRPDDDEVLQYYSELCLRHGGRLRARWILGFAIALPDGRCFDEAATVERLLVAPPCVRRRRGYPLDSLQREPRTGTYLAELSSDEETALWQDSIGGPLQHFVVATLTELHRSPQA